MAVNVTATPGQITGVSVNTGAVAIIFTDGTNIGFTVIVSSLLIAVAGEGQGTFGVKMTFTLSPWARVLLVNALLFVPTLTPFSCH